MDADRLAEKLRAQAIQQSDVPNSTRGFRANNPGNIRNGPTPWLGQVGTDAYGMCIFDSPESGIRALAKQLLVYHDKHGLCTIRGIISRYAPPEENDTAAYIHAVSTDTTFGPDDMLALREPAVLDAMVEAFIKHENGSQPYSSDQISRGVFEALV